MKQFSALLEILYHSQHKRQKKSALIRYFKTVNPADGIWALSLLIKRKSPRLISIRDLKAIVLDISDIPEWLFESCYQFIGDLTETISLICPQEPSQTHSLSFWMEYIEEFRKMSFELKRAELSRIWPCMDNKERFIFNKIISGTRLLNLESALLIEALESVSGLEYTAISMRLSSDWSPWKTDFNELLVTVNQVEKTALPFEYLEPEILSIEPSGQDSCQDWIAEYNWSGLRAQLIFRNGNLYCWVGKELMRNKFPELEILVKILPQNIVLEGMIMAIRDGQPLHVDNLENRIRKSSQTKKVMRETPIIFLSSDLLEHENRDIRQMTLEKRRRILEILVRECNSPVLKFSDQIAFENWDELSSKRNHQKQNYCNGVVLKKKSSTYDNLDGTAEWKTWKAEAHEIMVILMYAQRERGERLTGNAVCTFGASHQNSLVPVAKAALNLPEDETEQILKYVKENTIERFGPVLSVKPQLVFKLSFEHILLSKRSKSGITLTRPTILKWLKNIDPVQAASLGEIKALI
jgi:DNA ligase-1